MWYEDVDWEDVGDTVTVRLYNHYRWLERDELLSSAYLGIVQADAIYNPSRSPGRDKYIIHLYAQGFWLAINHLRSIHLIWQKGHIPKQRVIIYSRLSPNETVATGTGQRMGGLDMPPRKRPEPTSCRESLKGLSTREKVIMLLLYDEGLTPKEISESLKTPLKVIYRERKVALDKLAILTDRTRFLGEHICKRKRGSWVKTFNWRPNEKTPVGNPLGS